MPKPVPQTTETRIFALEEKDVRRDAHYNTLNKKIDELTDANSQVIYLLAGTNLNGNKGLVKLLETIEERVNAMTKQIESIQKDVDNSKYWGRAVTIFLSSAMLIILTTIFKIKL